jgi:PKD repeat protein
MVVGGVIANTFNVTAHGCHCTPVYEDPPEIDFYANATVGVVPLHVKFYAINTGGSVEQWYWEFGDGATSAERDPIHIYEVPGSYTVSLTATGPGGTDIATKHNYINAQALPEPPPDIDFEATPVSGYAPLTVNFVATNTGGLVEQWFWDFGDGNTSTLQDPTHVYETAGNYTVCLQATGPGGTDIERKEDYITIWKRIDEETLIEAPPTTELVLQATEELIIEGVHTLSCNITLSGWAKLIIEVTGTFNLTGNVTITKFAELRILGTYKQHGDIILSDWAMLIVDGGTMELFGDMCLEAHTVWVVQNDGRVIINLSTTPIRRPLPLTEERGWMHGEVYMSFTAKIVIKHSVVELNLPAGERKRYAIMCRGTIELINVELNSNAPAALEILGSLVTKRSIISGVSLTSSATATIETTTIGKLALNQMLQGGAEPPTAAVVHVRKSHIITIVAARDSNLMLYDTYVEELYAYDDAIITLQRAECATAYIYDNVTVTFIDAIVDMLTLTDNAYGTGCNTTFHSLYITAYAIVSVATSSMIYDLYADEHAILELLTCSVLKNYQLLNNSIIYYNHTLSVELTLNDKPLAGIKINIYELTDTFVKSITTDMMGKAEIRLAERIITHSSTRADLAYIVRVCVGQWAKSVTVNLTEDTFIPFRFIDRVPPNINKINLEVVQDALLVIYVEAYDEGYGIENITAICSIIEPERGSKLVRVPLQPISKSVYQTTIENLQAGSEIKVKVIVYDGAGNVNMSGWQTVVVGLMPWYYKTYAITLAIALGTAVVVVIAIHSIKKYLSKRRYLMREPRE